MRLHTFVLIHRCYIQIKIFKEHAFLLVAKLNKVTKNYFFNISLFVF